MITDDDVEAQNRVTLSSVFPADEHGPVPKVTFKQRQRSARTLRNREFLANKAAELLRAAGATKVHPHRLAAADPARAVDDAHGPERDRLGARRQRARRAR